MASDSEEKAEQGVAGYSPQVASPQNADVGSENKL